MKHKFINYIPSVIDDNTIYISIEYATAVHKCACGCEKEVVTPLSPTDWRFTYNGETISLYPSIGNWNFNCKSHYWIKKSKILWADSWDEETITLNRIGDKHNKIEYYKHKENDILNEININADLKEKSIWSFIKSIFKHLK